MPIDQRLRKVESTLGGDGNGCPNCRNAAVVTQYIVGFEGDELPEPQDTFCETCGRVIARGRTYTVVLDSPHLATEKTERRSCSRAGGW
ncbi:MAG: hypothetical protein KA354_16970 [Phycisphaerae bacterium]|nr:hypothetical protein [Phycisphaerae bacterium]